MQATQRLRRTAASEYLKETYGLSYKPTTLAKLATLGGGPAFEHFGRWPLYQAAELDRWVVSRLSPLKRSTSQVALPSGSLGVEQ